MKIIDYVINESIEDDLKLGYKFPYNASEILCSENVFVIDKYFEDVIREEINNEIVSLEECAEGLDNLKIVNKDEQDNVTNEIIENVGKKGK
jgi:hypothetical protein